MTTFTDLLEEKPSERERLSKYAIDENPSMRNFEEFEEALKSAFGKDSRGQGLLNFLNDAESKMLFESRVIQELIKENDGNPDIDIFEIQRTVPKGETTSKKDIQIIAIPERKFQIGSYNRKGKLISNYSKSYSRWTVAQNRFIQARMKEGLTNREVINEYNRHFRENQRSKSSLNTKIRRIRSR